MSHLDRNTWSTCSGIGTQLAPCGKESDLLDNLTHQQKLEDLYCNNFICCGKYWTDLHTLLQHCEEHHIDDIHKDKTLLMCDTDEKLANAEDDEDDTDEIPTPPSPSVAPQHLINKDFAMLGGAPISSSKPTIHSHETQEEYGYEKIKEWMHQAQLHPNFEQEQDDTPRPYHCQVRGCDKAYKNINGLKYHRQHGCCHERMGSSNEDNSGLKKPYRCSLGNCQKRYKNLNGLKYHIQHGHFKHRRSSTSSSSSSSSLNTPLSLKSNSGPTLVYK